MKKTADQLADEIIRDGRKFLDESKAWLISKGFATDLAEWVTIEQYTKRFNIKNYATVTNWIRRGIIPPEDIKVIPELNGIKLIRAKKYIGRP